MVRVGFVPAPAHGAAALADGRVAVARRRLRHLALPGHPAERAQAARQARRARQGDRGHADCQGEEFSIIRINQTDIWPM